MTDYRRVNRTLWLILTANILVAVAKASFGLMAGSMSMVADALHSTFDSASNVIGIIATRYAALPPDRNHPYGHAKVETLATLIIGGMLMLTAYWVISEGLGRLSGGASPTITGVTIAVMAGTLVVNLLVARYERRMGEELGSPFLIADSEHTKSDIWVSLSVLAGFVAVTLGYPIADPLIALLIGAVIGRMGLSILHEAGLILTDATTVECVEAVREAVAGIEGAKGFHRFRCRGTPGNLFADIHVTVDPQMSVEDAHAIASRVEAAIKGAVAGMQEVVVHIEPSRKEGEGKSG
ncbi:cation diffusion facilitator family transporter [Methanofollis fontis]|uniref:Cation transporter n=1 Tax=Methanofollis fontis TaxID=2052832 RepID=A0A483CQE2_9EURY|nr:cation diffusion facilitator family transporter [Methanofollis fontis]TAJ45333.1 cation transporter [Methanofollis fontis]